jgi:hypothetical protein
LFAINVKNSRKSSRASKSQWPGFADPANAAAGLNA